MLHRLKYMTTTEKILFANGIRPTVMRLKIYKYLKRKTYAVTLKEMHKVFIAKSQKNKTANRTTFYRNLKTFDDKGLIHQINDGTGVAKFAISDDNAKVNTVQIYICTFIVPIVEKQSVYRIKYRKKACQAIMK